MKIFSWNIQGGYRPQALAELNYLKNTIRPDIFFILETRTSNQNSTKILKSLNIDQFHIIDPINHSGGMWIIWNSHTVKVQNDIYSDRCAHLLIYCPRKKMNLMVTGIYGPARASDKDFFWDYLAHFHNQLTMPWMIIGDFNELLSYADKQGGRPLSNLRFMRMLNFLNITNGCDMPSPLNSFSWKKIINGALIYEKLDRVLVSNSFCDIFPYSKLTYKDFTISDHAPLLFDLEYDIGYKKRLFRFQNEWFRDLKVNKIVQSAWNNREPGSRFYRVSKKLLRVKQGIRTWLKDGGLHNKAKLDQNQVNIRKYENLLITSPNSTRIRKTLERLIKQREHLLLFGLHQKKDFTRKRWLTQGDRNSRYFNFIMR